MSNSQATPAGDSTYTQVGPYHCRLSFTRYSRPKPFERAKFVPQKTIILPLPLELMDTTSVDYNTTSLETVGDILNLNVTSGIGAIGLRMSGEQISQAGGAAFGALAQRLGSSAEAASSLSGSVSQNVLQADQITSAISAQLGLAPNPNQVVTFQGPKLREFSFSWTFYPETSDESKNIKKAIEEIRKRSLPFSVQGRESGVLGYPDMVLMNFYPWDNLGESNPNPYGWTSASIIRMKRCVIDRVAVNYAPNNVPAFFQGTTQPVAIRLELSLREIEYMMSEDYMDGVFTENGGVGGADAEARRLDGGVVLSMTVASAAGGAIIGGSVGGTPGAVVGGIVGGAAALGSAAVDAAVPASPGGTAQPAQPQAAPNPVQEAVAQPNGGR